MATALLPDPDRSALAVAAPGKGPGYWAGAPSAVASGGEIYLAYRLRRPLDQGRGYAVAVARSTDGENFETLLMIGKQEVRAESLERPALTRTPAGDWRLYLSCATYGTKHWRVEVIEARHPAEFDATRSQVTLPGDTKTGVKDPVIVRRGDVWELWASCHPLADPAEADQMVTDYATSIDGLQWTWHGTALSGRPGKWDARGTRIAAVHFVAGTIVAYLRRESERRGELRGADRARDWNRAECADRPGLGPVRGGATRRRPALPHRAGIAERTSSSVLRAHPAGGRARAAYRAQVTATAAGQSRAKKYVSPRVSRSG